ncbi:MAG: hypothetical protein GEU82_17485 [Luteitalea sp.]|nr:hypothetical protein [Luteitalea sp.]
MRKLTTFASPWKSLSVVCSAAALSISMAGPAEAQAAGDPNPGSITFTGGIDFPSVYVFRGILQEADPKLTMWPYGDIGLALATGDGAVKSVGLNIGVWHSLHTGSSGSDGPSDRLHYEEDFYTTLSLGFGGGLTLGTTFTAYTSANSSFNTVKELSFKLAKTHMLSPYGILAFELSDAQADGGSNKGTYLELGIGPAFPLAGGKATLTVPLKLGLSLNDYYELGSNDNKFGFFDIGGLVTVPLSTVESRFGSWNIHGGVDVLVFGDTTEAFNSGDGSKVVGLIGIGVTY